MYVSVTKHLGSATLVSSKFYLDSELLILEKDSQSVKPKGNSRSPRLGEDSQPSRLVEDSLPASLPMPNNSRSSRPAEHSVFPRPIDSQLSRLEEDSQSERPIHAHSLVSSSSVFRSEASGNNQVSPGEYCTQ